MSRDFIKKCKSIVQSLVAEKHILIKYLRDEQGNPYGCVVAVKTVDGFKIGSSLCNRREDNFNRYVGVYIAMQRAIKAVASNPGNDGVFRALLAMERRASKYFQMETVAA